ncbi:MAG: alpha/beta fold hydrolase [Actinobacteria bacterium]|nr:alpha/beta fold hydrolase [Actinomycetota bacterium]
MLASDSFGKGERLVFVHGFTQTRESWRDLTKTFSHENEVVLVDAPNHGDSSDTSLNLENGAKAIIEVGGQATYIGYSLGARLCLTAALTNPNQVSRLVLISGTAGIEASAERNQRIANDEQLATRIAQIGVSEFIDEWLAMPMFDGLTPQTNQRAMRLKNTTTALASSLKLCGAGKQQPSWSRLNELKMPVLIIAGQKDTKFATLAKRMADLIGSHAQLQIIANCGHTPQFEQPEMFLEVLSNFLRH